MRRRIPPVLVDKPAQLIRQQCADALPTPRGHRARLLQQHALDGYRDVGFDRHSRKIREALSQRQFAPKTVTPPGAWRPLTVTCHLRTLKGVKPSDALAIHRERIRAIVAHYGGVNPRVFGSVARGEDTEDSDLDILVDDPEGRRLNLFALGGMNYDISSLLGRPVDVIPSADLPPRMRNRAYADAVPL